LRVFGIKHPQATKEYDGPITLRKGYFMYRDGIKKLHKSANVCTN